MLTRNDLKEIEKLLAPIKDKQDEHTGRLLEIEKDIKAALELREDVSQARKQITDHEERITDLERI